jgi:hypothetical protein
MFAVHTLHDRGFGDVSMDFVEIIYEQLTQEANKRMKALHEHVESALYYKIRTSRNKCDIWSERYLVLYLWESSDSDHHQTKVVDTFNDKSV